MPRLGTARQRGEGGLCCAYCLDALEIPDGKNAKASQNRLGCCSRCKAVFHVKCQERELDLWILQGNGSGVCTCRCATCRAVFFSTADPTAREATISVTPPARREPLSVLIKNARLSMACSEQAIEKLRSKLVEVPPDSDRSRDLASVIQIFEDSLGRERCKLERLEGQRAASDRRKGLRNSISKRRR